QRRVDIARLDPESVSGGVSGEDLDAPIDSPRLRGGCARRCARSQTLADRNVPAREFPVGARVDEGALTEPGFRLRVIEVAAVLDYPTEAPVGSLQADRQRLAEQSFDPDCQLVLVHGFDAVVHGASERAAAPDTFAVIRNVRVLDDADRIEIPDTVIRSMAE